MTIVANPEHFCQLLNKLEYVLFFRVTAPIVSHINFDSNAAKSRILVIPLNGRISWKSDIEKKYVDTLMEQYHFFLLRILEKPSVSDLQAIEINSEKLKRRLKIF